MQFVARLWLVAFITLAVTQSRPLLFGERAAITVSDVAYPEFAGAVATRGGDAAEFCFVVYQPWACSIQRCSEKFRGLPT
jgi:hypothetical protein